MCTTMISEWGLMCTQQAFLCFFFLRHTSFCHTGLDWTRLGVRAVLVMGSGFDPGRAPGYLFATGQRGNGFTVPCHMRGYVTQR
jgi:hypothetical protein